MYQNKYPKMIVSIGIYSINRPEAGYGRGGSIYIYIHVHSCMCICVCMNRNIEILRSGSEA